MGAFFSCGGMDNDDEVVLAFVEGVPATFLPVDVGIENDFSWETVVLELFVEAPFLPAMIGIENDISWATMVLELFVVVPFLPTTIGIENDMS